MCIIASLVSSTVYNSGKMEIKIYRYITVLCLTLHETFQYSGSKDSLMMFITERNTWVDFPNVMFKLKLS